MDVVTDPVFLSPARTLTVAAVADLVGATMRSGTGADAAILALAAAAEGGPGTLVFVEGRKNRGLLPSLRATAVLCTDDMADAVPQGVAALVCARPQAAFAQVGRLLFPQAAVPGPMTGETGISPAAHVDPTARLEAGVVVEAGAVVAADVHIGAGTVIAPTAVVGRSCRIGRGGYVGPGAVVQFALIGDNVIIHPGAKIGQDGFGFTPGRSGPERIPQLGRVVIQNGVEIGTNATVDRGALGDTIIGESTKIDNLVQIAHNCRIGRSCIIAGLAGLSGSVTLGDGVLIGGGVGIADHLKIGAGARLAAGSGFMQDVPAGEVWAGYPAKPMGQTMREQVTLARLTKANAWKGMDNG